MSPYPCFLNSYCNFAFIKINKFTIKIKSNLFFEESENVTFCNVDQTSVDFSLVLSEDCEDVRDQDRDLALVQVDRVGEDVDHEVRVDDAGKRRQVVVRQHANLKFK